MNRTILLLLAVVIAISSTAQSLTNRVMHNDPKNYRELTAVHDGAGKMAFTQVIGSNDMATKFLYLHAGVVYPKGGIGHHFHHSIEEMYVLLSGEAEFTVNGRTSKLKAPVVVPCKMGDAHGLYNPTKDTLKWLNFGISSIKGRGDAFNTGDDLVGSAIDKTPKFVFSQLDVRPMRPGFAGRANPYPGEGVNYRRIFGPEVFSTNWDHVDMVVIPAGKSSGAHQLEGVEEVYYVIKGSGNISVNGSSASFKPDDAFTGKLGETISISSDGKEDVQLLVIGIAADKGWSIAQVPNLPKAMVLQMDFVVTKENAEAFEKMYYSIYVPAMKVQQGYISSKLLRLFPANIEKQIEGEATDYNYQVQICFDTEEHRRQWVASDQHKIAWPAATSLAKEYKWRGYDVMGDDDNR